MNNNPESNRSVARRGERDNPKPENEGPSWWTVALSVAAGAATVVGGAYLLSQHLEEQQEQRNATPTISDDSEDDSSEQDEITMDNLTDAISRLAVSPIPRVTNLNSLLNDIYVRYLAIKKEEFNRSYKVFKTVFFKLHKSMKAVDPYYNRYSSRLRFRSAEFKMNIVIQLPVNMHEDPREPEESDIVIEPNYADCVQLRAGVQYQNIIMRDGPNLMFNKQAFLWMDDSKYILRSKFSQWFQSVVDRALNTFKKCVVINGTEFHITTSSNKAAYTLWITNCAGFRLDVDLIPMLKFPEERWLGRSKSYRDIPEECRVGYWTVVPKPNKFGAESYDDDRSWHMEMYDQEKQFIQNSFHLRQAMHLLTKLREAQEMNHLEDYHIESLFLWKSLEVSQEFWQCEMASMFKVMLKEFYETLTNKKIPFFWKKAHNLIEKIPENILKGYANKLIMLVTALEDDEYMTAAEYLLTRSEYTEYMRILQVDPAKVQ